MSRMGKSTDIFHSASLLTLPFHSAHSVSLLTLPFRSAHSASLLTLPGSDVFYDKARILLIFAALLWPPYVTQYSAL